MYDVALSQYEAGRLAEAGESCRAILNERPRDFRALHLLGLIRYAEGMHDQAAFFLTAALGAAPAETPDIVPTLNALGMTLSTQGQFDAAIECYRRALAIQSGDASILYNYGNVLYAAQQYEEAIRAYRHALAMEPRRAELHNGLGNALRQAGQSDAAIESYRRAIALQPDRLESFNNLGRLLFQLDRTQEALDYHRQALALSPHDADTLTELGKVLRATGHMSIAEARYRKALEARPNDAEAWFGLGGILLDLYQHQEAMDCYRHAVAIEPMHGAARMGIGAALAGLNRHSEALDQYRQAAAIIPNSPHLRFNRALSNLTTGAFAEAWEDHEARLDITGWRTRLRMSDDSRLWRGDTDVAGKTILLQAEQGLGDTIQFVRYVPMVAARGARVVLGVQPALKQLLADFPGARSVLSPGDDIPPFDLQCPLMSLPLAFRTDQSSIPAEIPYLHADPSLVARWRERLGVRHAPRIGIAWSGSPSYRNDRSRSIPLSELAGLLHQPGFSFHILQNEIRPADADVLGEFPQFVRSGPESSDFAKTAALMSLMDLVISVDTSIAHLSGALGMPTWILLPYANDWRWLLDREDTPWYPTAKLFRQRTPGDWAEVVGRVVQALRRDLATG